MGRIKKVFESFSLWIHKHRILAKSIINFLMMISAGIYANMFVSKYSGTEDLLSRAFWSHPIHWWGLLPTVLFICDIAVFRLFVVTGKRLLVKNLHEAFARAMLFPRVQHLNLRVFCHLANKRSKELVPFCSWSWHHFPDADSRVPYEDDSVFVIARAFRTRDCTAEDLPPDHLDHVPDGVVVWPDLTSVIAASIRDYDLPNCEPIGTVSIDFDRTLAQMRLNSPAALNEAKELARRYGHLLYHIFKGKL